MKPERFSQPSLVKKPKRSLSVTLHILTLIVCTFLSPVLILRAMAAILTHGRLFDRRKLNNPHHGQFELLAFASQLPGRRLARLINLLRGELNWLGARPQDISPIPPGLFSPNNLHCPHGTLDQPLPTNHLPPELRTYLSLLGHTVLKSLLCAKRNQPTPDTVTLFGVPVSNASLQETLNWIIDRVRSGKKAMVPFVNAHCFNVACKNSSYHNVLKNATRILPDGSGVRFAFNFHSFNLKANLNGTDLFPHLCQQAAKEKLPIFLLGAAPGVAESVADKMTKRFPELQVAGTHHGFFTDHDEHDIIHRINHSGARLLLVAMGVPQQEIWLARNIHQLNTIVNLGVGGLFDFYAQRVSRAPLWLRELGMEWTWRFIQEPKRMWQRYILGNPVFLFRAWLDSRRHSAQYLIHRRGGAPVRRLRWWLSTQLNETGKRLLDIVISSLLLLALSALLAITALLIKIESPGPALFMQSRIGQRGTPFKFWKFRSMYLNAEQRKSELQAHNEMDGGVLFKIKKDPRITRIGCFIRRYSIDELPQLWNVLRGDMSLVGPRPALPLEVKQYSLADRQRLQATPGITCIWQVSGRSDIPFHRQVDLDVEYIHDASLGKDIKLLIKTIPAVISGRGAY